MKPRVSLCVVALLAGVAFTQTNDVPVLVRLSGAALDAKSAKVGDTFELTVSVPVKVDGAFVLPKGTKVRGHLTYVAAQAGKKDDSSLGFAFDVARLADASEVKLDGVVQAVAVPRRSTSDDDPLASMEHSAAANNRGGPSAPSNETIGSTGMQREHLSSATPHDGDVTTESTGVSGLPDAFLNLELSNQTQSSVLTGRKQSLKLPVNTRLVLQVRAIPSWPATGK